MLTTQLNTAEQQKAYHLRKMRTRYARIDVNKDGYISREDYELMGKKLVEYSGMKGEQAESTCKGFLKIADVLNLQPGVKLPFQQIAEQANVAMLSMSPEDRKALLKLNHDLLFDVIDSNNDGHISVNELKIYFQMKAPGLSEKEVVHSFNTIDANKNGEISREEFMAAAEDFLFGVEETELSEVFFGKLLD